ncbi:hypothetical protein DPEC_G00005500 [Dallia pectoralis]|uniref:Uncharacterized protein n=1 Tax=Dallia pectoralis TaxID=75939 RepID=A0ACC2HJR9_DALPE|nr:hypothetical protein DPEC_G00005500 [Dallia pectoralis]
MGVCCPHTVVAQASAIPDIKVISPSTGRGTSDSSQGYESSTLEEEDFQRGWCGPDRRENPPRQRSLSYGRRFATGSRAARVKALETSNARAGVCVSSVIQSMHLCLYDLCPALHLLQNMHPATAKWYDRRDSVYIEFCVADSKDVKVSFEKAKFVFSCLAGTDQVKHENDVDLFEAIDENESMHKRTDRSVFCCLRKAEPGKAWPRLTKEKAKLTWLSVDFNNWKDWEDDSDEEPGNFDRFSEVGDGDMAFNTQEAMAKMMNNMGGEDDLPDLDAADDDESADSDDEKMPDLE